MEVLVEQNINGKIDTSYIYGVDRLCLDRFDDSTGYYLYDPRGSVSGITNEEGQIYQSYRYSVTGEITFGKPQYENEYTYNGESYNPNIESQYLGARYYCVVTATFLTEDSYLGDITEPLTLNRYNYCLSSYLNYQDPSGNRAVVNWFKDLYDSFMSWYNGDFDPKPIIVVPEKIDSSSQENRVFKNKLPNNKLEHGNFIRDTYIEDVQQDAQDGMVILECYALVGEDELRLTDEQQIMNAQYIYEYLFNEGWTKEAICGLFGNIQEESQFNPGVWQDLDNAQMGYGLVQYTPVSEKFFFWLEEYEGYDMGIEYGESDKGIEVVNELASTNPQLLIDLQLEYIMWSSSKYTPIDYKEWYATLNYDSPYKMTYEEYIISTESAEELALVFHASYERSSDNKEKREERSASALKWYEYFTDN